MCQGLYYDDLMKFWGNRVGGFPFDLLVCQLSFDRQSV